VSGSYIFGIPTPSFRIYPVKRSILLIGLYAFLALEQIGQCAVVSRDWKTPGDGLLTYDDVNQREWLDLTQSRLSMFAGSGYEQRYQSAGPQFALRGAFYGFHPAKSADLSALSLSAGIVPGAEFATNAGPTQSLIELVGPSAISSLDPADRVAFGLLDQLGPAPTTNLRLYGELLHFVPRPATMGSAGLLIRAGLDVNDLATPANSGIWMSRSIPEPSSTFSSLVGALFFIRRASHT
jgi:hypothetical protein